ncbi:hypothetical protein ACMD2_16548 [Ananas comosus]|uniref:Uncharacterized protein n=1 Tax=Ananas comosus TaxID=4615 RepID=A0A199VXU7_ANACO|nr:hypothetical protein ACMD2_16548 [Ananas comosus]
MAKNRNKKKKNNGGAVAMDVSDEGARDAPQPMDTSEGKATSTPLLAMNRKIKKAPAKRAKNTRKLKAVARAVSKNEKSEEKISKRKHKLLRVQAAKSLYD